MTDWIKPRNERAELERYCRSDLAEPKRRLWTPGPAAEPSADLPEIKLDLGGIPLEINVLQQAHRKVTRNSRYGYAAWRWIQPFPRPMRLAELEGLQAQAGLNHYAAGAFVATLKHHCQQLRALHPRLDRWIRVRESLLDHVIRPCGPLPDKLRDLPAVLEAEYLRAAALLGRGDEGAIAAARIAERTQRDALTAAGHALCSVFQEQDRETGFTVNMMVPLPCDGARNGPELALSQASRRKSEAARAIWAGLREFESYLVVAGETNPDEHLGFWVPAFKDHSTQPLPGATSAYQRREGCAVFKEDLDRLGPKFPEELERDWHHYMHKEFKERLFVSIPLILPMKGANSTKSIVAAVVNINAAPAEEDDFWLRAYHREWLRVATERVTPFARISFWCHHIKCTAMPDWVPALDVSSELWKRFPAQGSEGPKRLS